MLWTLTQGAYKRQITYSLQNKNFKYLGREFFFINVQHILDTAKIYKFMYIPDMYISIYIWAYTQRSRTAHIMWTLCVS